MASNESTIQHQGSPDRRPAWPYEMWITEEIAEMKEATNAEYSPDKTPKEEEIAFDKSAPSEEPFEDKLDDVHVADHWSDELDTTITDSCPINTLLNAISLPDVSVSLAARQTNSLMTTMMKNTLDNLIITYKVFQDSYLMPVGSMTENTKIHEADEFDFAVILPILAQEEYCSLVGNKSEKVPNPSTKALLDEIVNIGDIEVAFQEFQHLLRKLWSIHMRDNIPGGWTVLNPLGHSEKQSVAATFHLERKSDKTKVDLDVCFWIPLDAKCLSRFPVDDLPQRDYLIRNCLDKNGLVYAILPQDRNICLITNVIRFAMSPLERETLQKFGPENGRLRCYRLCKCIAAALIPKVRKSEDCVHCFDSLISSYCLKNIVLYMIAYYTDDASWTTETIPNRVFEVFLILTFCVKVNCGMVSAYFTPYQLDIDMNMSYDPKNKCVSDRSNECLDFSQVPCSLPNLVSIKNQTEDEASIQAMTDYETFLIGSEWRYPEVICRLTELLTVLMYEDKTDREEMVKEPGWNYFGLNLSETGSYQISVDTEWETD